MNIKSYVDAIDRQGLKVEGLKVYQHDKKIAEHHWVPEETRHVWSISKSFTSVAVGMLYDEGKLSLSEKVVDFFSDIVKSPDGRQKKVTLEHLLTMTRGRERTLAANNLVEAVNQPLTLDPGTGFGYDSTSSFIISAMVTRLTGLKLRDFLLDRLFRPLDIPDPVWDESDDGYSLGGFGLHISTSNMAQFGLFLLHRGLWKGKQLVSSAWLDGATRAQVPNAYSPFAGDSPGDCDIGYGYHFWMCRHGAFRCDGKEGQFIVVLPRQDAVIAINSGEANMRPILYTVWDYLLPQL